STQSGDAETTRNLLYPNNADEARLAELVAQSVAQNQKFRQAVSKAFGDASADAFAGSQQDTSRLEIIISRAKVTTDKSTATLIVAEGADAVKLVQVDGKWKLSMAGQTEDNAIARQQASLTVLSEVTDELGQRKYKTELELRDALQRKSAN